MTAPFELDEGVAAFIETGIALVIGTANAAREPEVCRGWGPRWRAETGLLEALLPMPAATTAVQNLSEASAVALTFSKPTDYTAFQLKGECLEICGLDAAHWRRARHHFDAFLIEASSVGLDPAAFAPWFPAEGLLLVARIDQAFCQAPGPKAGVPL